MKTDYKALAKKLTQHLDTTLKGTRYWYGCEHHLETHPRQASLKVEIRDSMSREAINAISAFADANGVSWEILPKHHSWPEILIK